MSGLQRTQRDPPFNDALYGHAAPPSLQTNIAYALRLPPEILRAVLDIHVAICQHPTVRSTWTWIRITHVCRAWRAVAQEYPKLWQRIVLPCPLPYLHSSIHLSRTLPLDILLAEHCARGATISRPAWDAIITQLGRIRGIDLFTKELRLVGDSEEPDHETPYLHAPVPAPIIARHLHYLTVCVNEWNHIRRLMRRIKAAPHLRSLKLTWNRNVWPVVKKFRHSLFELRIIWRSKDGHKSIALYNKSELREVMDGLRPLSERLRQLEIPCFFTGANSDEHGHDLHLPQLRALVLTGSLLSCATLLAHIILPHMTEIAIIAILHTRGDRDAAASLGVSIPKLLGGDPQRRRDPQQLRAITFEEFGKPNGRQLNVSGCTDLTSARPQSVEYRTKFKIQFPSHPNIFRDFVRHLPLAHLEILAVVNVGKHHIDDLTKFVRALETVEELVLGDCTLGWAARVLQPEINGQCPLPRLRILHLVWNELLQFCPRQSMTPECGECLHLLGHALAARKALGHELQQLNFAGTTMPDESHWEAFLEMDLDDMVVACNVKYSSASPATAKNLATAKGAVLGLTVAEEAGRSHEE